MRYFVLTDLSPNPSPEVGGALIQVSTIKELAKTSWTEGERPN